MLAGRYRLWFDGYVYASINTKNSARFVNLCKNRKIDIKNIENKENKIFFIIQASKYMELKPIIRKIKEKPMIIHKNGFPFFLHRYKKRMPLVIGCILSIVVLYICSLYIWEISVLGNNTYSKETIVRYLKTINVTEGIRIDDLKCHDIETSIRKKYNDIGWVSAEIVGTRLNIRIEENANLDNLQGSTNSINNTNNAKHIISDESGKVISIITRKGKPLVKVGEEVEKNQMIVSGIIDIVGDSGIVLGKKSCYADADIYIQYNQKYEDSFSRSYTKKKYTGKKQKELAFLCNNCKIVLLKPLNFNKICDIIDMNLFSKGNSKDNNLLIKKSCVENTYNITLFNNFVLPIRYQIKEYMEYISTTKLYDYDSAKEEAYKRFEKYCKELGESKAEVIKNKLSVKCEDNNIKVSGDLVIIKKNEGLKDVDFNELIINEDNIEQTIE